MPDNTPPLFTPLPAEEIADFNEQSRTLLLQLDSKHEVVREQAIRECWTLPVQHIVILIEALEEKPRIFTATERRLRFWMASAVTFTISLLIIIGTLTVSVPCLICASICFMVLFIWAMSASFPVSLCSPRALESLGVVIRQIRDPAFLLPAMQILSTQYGVATHDYQGEIPKALSHTTAHLLRTLDIAEIKDLGIQQEALYWFLRPACWRQNPITTVRVLNILEVIGTPSAIPTVKKVGLEAMQRGLSDIKWAAVACLEFLMERERQSNLPSTLLRAAEAPAPAADTLLRPATGSADDAPAQLLRAAAPTVDE